MTQSIFILDRATIDSVTDLIAQFGGAAGSEAAARAAQSRDRGNIYHFCRWRQVGRLVALFERESAIGTVH